LADRLNRGANPKSTGNIQNHPCGDTHFLTQVNVLLQLVVLAAWQCENNLIYDPLVEHVQKIRYAPEHRLAAEFLSRDVPVGAQKANYTDPP
jgi:hypothetical protein